MTVPCHGLRVSCGLSPGLQCCLVCPRRAQLPGIRIWFPWAGTQGRGGAAGLPQRQRCCWLRMLARSPLAWRWRFAQSGPLRALSASRRRWRSCEWKRELLKENRVVRWRSRAPLAWPCRCPLLSASSRRRRLHSASLSASSLWRRAIRMRCASLRRSVSLRSLAAFRRCSRAASWAAFSCGIA